jgi:hypothetical protein
MADDLNLDINSYNKEELLQLFNCEEVHSKNYITKAYNKKLRSINKVSNKSLQIKLKSFFNNAFKKLTKIIPHLSENNEPIFTNVVSRIENSVTSKMHPMPIIDEPSIQATQPIRYPLGNINPVERKTQSIIFSLDTLFRDIHNYPKSNDFIYELPVPIENVISMKLLSAEIPNTQPLYSENTQNNKFIITMFNGMEPVLDINGKETGDVKSFPPEGKTLQIILPNGSPSFTTLISFIQQIIDSQRNSFSLLQMGIDNITGLLFFRFKTLSECVSWNSTYFFDGIGQSVFPPDNKPPTKAFKMPSANISGLPEYNVLKRVYLGSKIADERNIQPETSGDENQEKIVNRYELKYSINFNPYKFTEKRSLGWSLGYRNVKNDYFYTYDNTFQRGFILFNGFYPAVVPYGDAEPDYNYVYVNEFTGSYNDTLLASSDNTYLAKSILARLQVDSAFFGVQFQSNNGGEISVLDKKRDYFGPVNIEKLHIKILNKFGDVADMVNVNYSLTFQFETLYSSIRN